MTQHDLKSNVFQTQFDKDGGGTIDSDELGDLVRVLGYR